MDFENVKLIDIEPTYGCNLKCRMCHVSFMDNKVKYLDVRGINWEFCRDKRVILGAVFEPLIHPDINYLIDSLNKVNAKIDLITNAHNLNKKEIPALFESNLGVVTFSFDGIEKDSYEEIRRGGKYSRTLENIRSFTEKHKGSGAVFAVNFTVMKRNLHEVEKAPSFWEKYNIDLVRFINMVVRENDEYLLNNTLWKVQDRYEDQIFSAMKSIEENNLNISISSPNLRNEKFGSLENGIFSILKDDDRFISTHHNYEYSELSPISNGCQSPFVAIRLNWESDVFVCQNIKVGNFQEKSFDEIWGSVELKKIRDEFVSGSDTCSKCDYYRFCVNSHYIESSNVDNFFSSNFKRKYPEQWSEIIASSKS